MPNKSRRVASRQAEIASKKRRSAKKTRNDNHPLEHMVDSSFNSSQNLISESNADRSHLSEPITNLRNATPNSTRPQARVNNNPQPKNPYIWGELKRIGLITAIVSSALVLLTFIM